MHIMCVTNTALNTYSNPNAILAGDIKKKEKRKKKK